MKILIGILTGFSALLYAQTTTINPSWTTTELATAHTAKDVRYMDDFEKEVILYINLARLYPKKFMELEAKEYNGTVKYVNYVKDSPYKKSLLKELASLKPMGALYPDSVMADNADCFAQEMGAKGTTGHNRIKCPKMNFAECCSYGMTTGRDVAMQLLIDDKVSTLGHRRICLDRTYTKIGAGFAKHKVWDECCVLEIIW